MDGLFFACATSVSHALSLECKEPAHLEPAHSEIQRIRLVVADQIRVVLDDRWHRLTSLPRSARCSCSDGSHTEAARSDGNGVDAAAALRFLLIFHSLLSAFSLRLGRRRRRRPLECRNLRDRDPVLKVAVPVVLELFLPRARLDRPCGRDRLDD